jgi:hypothetical protein
MAALTSFEYPYAIGSVTIANGASLSDLLDLQGSALAGVQFPAAWTAAGVAFEVSADGTTFQPLYNSAGEVAYSTSAAAASRSLSVNGEDFLGWRYVKVRSGTSGSPVNQGAARVLVLTGRAA